MKSHIEFPIAAGRNKYARAWQEKQVELGKLPRVDTNTGHAFEKDAKNVP